jgi:sporulation protein YlmC with PRC-barrel domain
MTSKIKNGLIFSLMISSWLFVPLAQAAQGLYSMKALMDAPVYAEGHAKSIGEVDNIIVDEQMKITGIVIDVDDTASSMDGKKLFVQTGLFRLKTERDTQLDDVRYSVHLNESVTGITDYPVVDNSWWQTAKQTAAAVWEKTKSTARSAWDATKEATRNVLDTIREKTQ